MRGKMSCVRPTGARGQGVNVPPAQRFGQSFRSLAQTRVMTSAPASRSARANNLRPPVVAVQAGLATKIRIPLTWSDILVPLRLKLADFRSESLRTWQMGMRSTPICHAQAKVLTGYGGKVSARAHFSTV